MQGGWFTVEKVDSDTFIISEYRHWEEVHCYLLIGVKKALLIDTGLGVGNLKSVVSDLTRLPVEVVTTHVHWDHIGGHRFFQNIAVFEDEEKWLSGQFPLPLSVVKESLLKEPCHFPENFDIAAYQIYQNGAACVLHDGDIIDLQSRRLRVIHTPGHSPGHICLYEKERQYLFSGDLVYAGCLDAFYPTTDPDLFRASIKKVKDLPIQRILPGHHQWDIPPSLIQKIDGAFDELWQAGKLKHGMGIFDFHQFQIHI